MPVVGAGGWPSDLLAAIGLALAAAACLGWLFRIIAARPPKVAPAPSLDARLAALDGLTDDAQRFGLYALIKRHAPQAAAEFQGALYDPALPFDATRARALILGREAPDA